MADQTDKWESPLFVNVAIPTYVEKRHGIHSTKHEAGERFTIRFNPAETQSINEAARLLEMPASSLIRAFCVQVADKVRENYNAYLKSRGGG